ncbi:MAG: hypothetical protein Q9157_004349 [Trypethelium eluteriae]
MPDSQDVVTDHDEFQTGITESSSKDPSAAQEPQRPPIAIDQDIEPPIPLGKPLQYSEGTQAELPAPSVQEAGGPVPSSEHRSTEVTDSFNPLTVGIHAKSNNLETHDALNATNLAMQPPVQQNVNPGALHCNAGDGMMYNGIGLSLQALNDASQLNADALGSMDDMDLTAYAKLEFPDTTYLVRTTSVELGRDNIAMRRATRLAEQRVSESESQSRPSSAGEALRTPMHQSSRFSGGCHAYSEEGGIMKWEESSSDSNPNTRRKKGRKKKPSNKTQQSAITPSQYEAALNAAVIDDQRRAYPPHDACPLLPIHIADSWGPDGYKGISRKHAKIQYNPNKEVFELHVIARNGLFLNDAIHHAGETIPLRDRDVIQIGPVPITFGLPPDVAARDRDDSDEISYQTEDSMVNTSTQDSPEQSSSARGSIEEPVNIIGPDEQGTQSSNSEEEQERPQQRTKLKLKVLPTRQKSKGPPYTKKKDSKLVSSRKEAKRAKNPKSERSTEPRREKHTARETSPTIAEASSAQQNGTESVPPATEVPQKRKGPGRPPKDGIMSKRERQARAKQEKEAKRARELGLPPPPPLDLKTKTEKKKQKKEEEEAAAAAATARSATADTEKSPQDIEPKPAATVDEEAASSQQQGLAKSSKAAARTPSPPMKESDYTEEQLTRPSSNYITLIYEAITNSKNGQMNLQQIYGAIERRYPHFKFRIGSQGWQSSVRHNLGQNSIFQKVEKEGKGYLWAVKAGATPESQKRKRSSPPRMSQHAYYPPNHYLGLQNGPGQPHHGPSPYPQHPQHPHRPPYAPPSTAGPAVVAPPAQNSGNYSSPYAVNPPVSVHRAPQAPSSLSNGVAYSQPQQPSANVRIPNRSVSMASQPSSSTQPAPPPHPPVDPAPFLTALIGNDYPKHLRMSLPGNAEVLTVDMIQRLKKFKDVFVDVSQGDKEHSEHLVCSAIKRVFWPGESTTPLRQGEEDITKTLSGLILPSHEKKEATSTQAAPGQAGAMSAIPSHVSPVARAQHAAVVAQPTHVPASTPVAVQPNGANGANGTSPNAVTPQPSAPIASTPSAAASTLSHSTNPNADAAPAPPTPPSSSQPHQSPVPVPPTTNDRPAGSDSPQPPSVEALTPTAPSPGTNGHTKRDREMEMSEGEKRVMRGKRPKVDADAEGGAEEAE